jgi:beta-hydroxylase
MKRRLAMRLVVKAANFGFYRLLFRPAEWLVRRFSSVGQHTFFAPEQFGWIAPVEAGWPAIRDELRNVLRERARIPSFHEVSSEQLKITHDDKWKTYWFCAYGRKFADNCRRCPETARLLETIPGMKTAFFSILAPRKHIPEHRGPYGGVLRYHLGLVVPQQENACRIRVGGEIAHWEEGRSVVFDDTYLHEVWNDTDEERVVLFVDFARPLPFPLSLLNDLAIRLFAQSEYIQEIVEKVERWNRPIGVEPAGERPSAAS